jgi:hypothetical protein
LSNQWLRCSPGASTCETIDGATGSSYQITQADAGFQVKLRVTGRPQFDPPSYREADSNSTDVIPSPPGPPGSTGQPPVNVKAPKILGTVRAGNLLTATSGAWTGDGPITFTYTWTSCAQDCHTVSQGKTYRPVASDVGRRLMLSVFAKSPAGKAQFNVFTRPVAKKPVFKRLSPFPVLTVGGRVAGAVTTITGMRLRRVPRGSTVTMACAGKGCPFRKSRLKVRGGSTARLRKLERRLPAGLTVVITIRKGNTLGKYIRIKIRRGLAPARIDRCVSPGSSRPLSCP